MKLTIHALTLTLMLAAAITLAVAGCQAIPTEYRPTPTPAAAKHAVPDIPEYHRTNSHILDHRLADGEEELRVKLQEFQQKGYDTAELTRGAPPGHVRFILWNTD